MKAAASPAAARPASCSSAARRCRQLIGRHEDFLFVTGLGGTACDVGAVTGDGAHVYSLGGAMGAPCMMGLGLALARPDKRVLVVTGDGDLLMNVGALATIAVINPPNLAIVCVDNGHYGETGWQKSHTSLGVDLEKMAIGAGIKRTCTVAAEADIAAGARLLREGNGTCVRAAARAADRAGAVQAQFRRLVLPRPLQGGAAAATRVTGPETVSHLQPVPAFGCTDATTSATACPSSISPLPLWERASRYWNCEEWVRGFSHAESMKTPHPFIASPAPSCPLPQGERAKAARPARTRRRTWQRD